MIRRFVLLALTVALCACGGGDSRDPFTDSRIPPSLGPAYWPPPGWAWGLIQVSKGPAQRYGVAAVVNRAPIAQLLILPGYGDLAEAHFQDANGFVARRIQVWILDGIGQGGSGRLALPRDLGHVESFQGDIDGLGDMVGQVIRPGPGGPLVAIADGTAAPVLLRAVQQGLPGVAAVILTEPRITGQGRIAPPASPLAVLWARWMGHGRRRAPGASGWRREPDLAADGSPAFVRHAWQLANPDLRMGGPSTGWLAAFDELLAVVRAGGWSRAGLPVLVLSDPGAPAAARAAEQRLCRALPRCELAVAEPAQWPDRETVFVEKVAAAAKIPRNFPPFPSPAMGDSL